MYMKLSVLFTALLSGCTTVDRTDLTPWVGQKGVIVWEVVEEMEEPKIRGKAYTNGKLCKIKFEPNTCTALHEFLHCIKGKWHGGLPNGDCQ